MQNYFQSRSFQRVNGTFQPEFFCNILGISLGGGKEKSTFVEDTTQKKETEQITAAKTIAENERLKIEESTAAKTAKSIAESTGTSLTQALDETKEAGSVSEAFQSLDAETQALLQGLIGDLGEGGLQELVSSLTGRGLDAESELAGITDPIVANLRGNLEEQLGQSIQGFARAAGGTTQNTIVQQLGLAGASRVEREVADLAASLGLETRQLATEEQLNAANLTGSLLTQLTGLLKGSQTIRAGESANETVRALEQLTATEAVDRVASEELTTALSETALSELSTTVSESTMQEIINAITKATGTGKTKGASFGISI